MREFAARVKRHYFEAFGDLEKEIQFLRYANLALTLIIFFLILTSLFLGMKPPVVIRVSDVEGARAVGDLHTNNEPTVVEMIAFSKRFTSRYTAFNSFTVTKDLEEAFNQMTSKMQEESKKALIDSGLVEKLKDSGVDTRLEFKESKLERDSDEAALISLIGTRLVTKYHDSRFHEEILFRADLALKKVRRTERVPEGLLVEAYREITLNDLSRKEETKP